MRNQEEAIVEILAERLIRHEEERDYYVEVPFELPEHVEELEVEMEAVALGEGRLTIDLGLKDPQRVRGWSGGARTRFAVGREKATPGYLPGELMPGEWAVLLGAYRVPQAGCKIVLRIRCRAERRRWLKGDLHSHTVHSDGSYTLGEAVSIMESLGCDFLATTDHNTVSQNFVHPKESGLVLIPGIELTTNRGHANFLGAVDPIRDFRVHRVDDIHAHFAAAKEKGAVVVLNHPLCGDCPWEWGFAVDHDWVEVWNGPWTDRNERALDWWQAELAAGRRLVAVGGSDVHRPHPHVKHAMPTTWVYAASRTVAGILEGIGRGHAFLSESPDGPTIKLRIGAAMIGDTIEYSDDVACADACLQAERLQPGDAIRIVTERGAERELVADGESVACEWQAALGRLFYRIEIRRFCPERGEAVMAALSNPIYMRPLAATPVVPRL